MESRDKGDPVSPSLNDEDGLESFNKFVGLSDSSDEHGPLNACVTYQSRIARGAYGEVHKVSSA